MTDSGSSTAELLQAREDGVAVLTLNRPHAGNALSASLVEALSQALQTLESDADVHTILLRGAGRHFCTGFDLSGLDEQSDGDLLHRFVRIEMLLAALWHSPLRTVVLAHGRTWGAGADIVAACELRTAAARTTFRFPGAQFGLVLGSGRLARRIGPDRARQWITSGHEASTEEACASGLVTTVLEAGELAAWQSALTVAPVVCQDTARMVRAMTAPDQRDADMACLVASAARPGLRQRISTYIQQQSRSR